MCRDASPLALKRVKQAILRLGQSQHGEKSLKFHSINSNVGYAKRFFFPLDHTHKKKEIRKPFSVYLETLSMMPTAPNTSI